MLTNPSPAEATDQTETWPTNKNPLDSPSTGQDLNWTTEADTFQVTSNHLEPTSVLGANTVARCTDVVATQNHRVIADYVAVISAGTGPTLVVGCRKDGANDTYYGIRVTRDTTLNISRFSKFVSGTQTIFETISNDVGSPGSMFVQANGSTIDATAGVNVHATKVDTAIVNFLNMRVSLLANVATSDAQFDNVRQFDLGGVGIGTGGGPVPLRTILGVGQ